MKRGLLSEEQTKSSKKMKRDETETVSLRTMETPCGDSQEQFGGMCAYHAMANAFGLCLSFGQIMKLQEKYHAMYPDRFRGPHVESLKKHYHMRNNKQKLLSMKEYIYTNIGVHVEQEIYILNTYLGSDYNFYHITKKEGLENVENLKLEGQRAYLALRLNLPKGKIPYFDLFQVFILHINLYNFYKHFKSIVQDPKFKDDVEDRVPSLN